MILIVGPWHDIPTSISVMAARHLEDYCKSNNVLSKFLFGPMAYRAIFESTMVFDQINMIAYYGHGVPDGLLGQHIISKILDTRNSSLTKNKVVYTMACWTSNILGPDTIKKGANAYFGHKTWYYGAITNEEHDYLSDWIDTVTIIPKALISGKTTQEALDLYKNTIEKLLNNYKNNMYLCWDWYYYAFKSNLDHFSLMGNRRMRL